VSATGEQLCAVRSILGPVQGLQMMFTMMPARSEADWSAIAKRIALVPQARAGYAVSLREGVARGLLAPSRQVGAFTAQLQDWGAEGEGRGWFAQFCDAAQVPDSLRAELDQAADPTHLEVARTPTRSNGKTPGQPRNDQSNGR